MLLLVLYFSHLFLNKCILSTYCVLDVVLDAEDKVEDRQIQSLPVECW